MADVLTIREAVRRAKAEGLTVSEYGVRRWVKSGALPTRTVGQKALIFYPNLVRFLRCENSDVGKFSEFGGASGIRPIDPNAGGSYGR